MMPRWNRPLPAPPAAPRFLAGLRSSGTSRSHHSSLPKIATSFKPNLQKAYCTNETGCALRSLELKFIDILIWVDAQANLPIPGKVDRESGCGS